MELTEIIFDPHEYAVCDDCGEIYMHGDWPFCASERNPEGHAKGTYGWRVGFSMKTQGWTRRER